jgi:hypothetical protein
MYGKRSYQATRRYVDWLYTTSPSSRGPADCLVALEQGSIVGCVHRMRLPCITEAGPATLVSLQNHVVSPKFRGGAGVMLLQRAVKGERMTLSPGVSGRLRDAYRRLGYDELPSFWLMRVLNPFKVAVQAAARVLSAGTWPGSRLRTSAHRSNVSPIRVTLDPNTEQLERLAEALTAQAREQIGAYVPWDPSLLRWRFF